MSTLLAKIHIAKKDLALTDETYRDIISFHFPGKSSAKELSPRQQIVLLNHFKARGWQPQPPKRAGRQPFAKGAPADRTALLRKIEALLADLNLPWAYATGMARKICHVDALEFCDAGQLGKIVAAMVYHTRRQAAKRG